MTTDEEEQVSKQNYEEKYTHPELREKVKEEIKASDKGGKEGQWSARKSQLLTQEYEKRGGGYKGKKGQSQKNLEEWTEEEWQTKEGEADARQDGGETKRYLPKKAWENMSEEEKKETEQKKREGSKKGQHYVSNTEEAKKARKNAEEVPINGYDDLSVEIWSASSILFAPMGMTMNSWKSRSLVACLPPFMRLTSGTGRTCASAFR